MGRPGKIFVYYISIVLVFTGLVYLIPENIISLPVPNRPIPPVDSFMLSPGKEFHDSVQSETDPVADTTKERTTADTSTVQKPEIHRNIPFLIVPDDFTDKFSTFFKKARSAKKEGKTIRVLHMGDSQIEGDRITRYIRESMQERFGGTGPGLFTVVDPHKLNPSIILDNYGDWTVYTIFDRKNVLKNRQYGIMGTVAKFNPAVKGNGFRFRPSPWAEKKAKKYYKVRLFLGEIKDAMTLEGYIGNEKIISDTLGCSKGITEINWEFEDNVPKLKLMFTSASSPPFLGCALDSLAGIAVDNLALRGQSIPWLQRTDHTLFKTMTSYLDVGLIIFQFGTNMIPTKTYNFRFYRIKLERQLKLLKKLSPGCPVIVVGTGDAAFLDKGAPTSYDHLAALNKAQKEAALNAGAAFFDLYNAMGGKGTIIKWVEMEPPLAISDYIHFTKEGGKHVAEMMLKSIYALSDSLSANEEKPIHEPETNKNASADSSHKKNGYVKPLPEDISKQQKNEPENKNRLIPESEKK